MVKRGILFAMIIALTIISINSNAQNLFFTGVVLNPKVITVNQAINLTIEADKSFKFFEKAFLCGGTGKKEISLNGKRFSRAVIQNNTCIRNCQQEQWYEGSINSTFKFPLDTQDGTYSINVYGCRIITSAWNCTWFSGIVQYASDIIPPEILTLTPDNNAVVTNGKNLKLSMTFNDQGAGIDPNKVLFILTGKNTVQESSIKPSSVTATSATATLTEGLLKGHYSLTGIIVDKSGNKATKTNIIDVGIAKETTLIIKDLIPDNGAASSSPKALWSIKTLVHGLQEIELGKLTNNVFTDISSGEGILLFDSVGNTNWDAQKIIIKTERGTFDIFLPSDSNIGCGQGNQGRVKYYIAADGSSYYADSLNNGCGSLSEPEAALIPSHLARGSS